MRNVDIDVCEDCGGVWLDRGELERLSQPDEPTLLATSAPADGATLQDGVAATDEAPDPPQPSKKSESKTKRPKSKSKKSKSKKKRKKGWADAIEDALDDLLDDVFD